MCKVKGELLHSWLGLLLMGFTFGIGYEVAEWLIGLLTH